MCSTTSFDNKTEPFDQHPLSHQLELSCHPLLHYWLSQECPVHPLYSSYKPYKMNGSNNNRQYFPIRTSNCPVI